MSKIKEYRQFILFCFVGLINTTLDLSMYFGLHQILGIPTFAASPIVVFTVMTISYVMNAKIVFPSELKLGQYLSFMLFTGVGLVVIQTTISTLFESWAQDYLLNIQIFDNEDLNIFIANSIVRITGVVFSLSWNFCFYKYVVFRDKQNIKGMLNEVLWNDER